MFVAAKTKEASLHSEIVLKLLLKCFQVCMLNIMRQIKLATDQYT